MSYAARDLSLEERVARLERMFGLGEPTPYPTWPTPAKPPSCAVCGILFEGPMGYACPRSDCPAAVRAVS